MLFITVYNNLDFLSVSEQTYKKKMKAYLSMHVYHAMLIHTQSNFVIGKVTHDIWDDYTGS